MSDTNVTENAKLQRWKQKAKVQTWCYTAAPFANWAGKKINGIREENKNLTGTSFVGQFMGTKMCARFQSLF